MNKREKVIWTLILLSCALVIVLLFWNNNVFQSNNRQRFSPNIGKKLPESKTTPTGTSYKFYFYPLTKSWVLSQYQNFWKQELTKSKIPDQWTIGNYLDYFWPQWREYYLISEKTLQRKIKASNVVWYQYKEKIKKRKARKAVDLQALNSLDINTKKFKTKNAVLEQLVDLLQDETKSWKIITSFIDANFKQNEANKLKKLLQTNLWSFEWTDFYPEAS